MTHFLQALIPDAPDETNIDQETERWLYDNFEFIIERLQNGVSGSFTTVDGKTVTVTNGIITNIV